MSVGQASAFAKNTRAVVAEAEEVDVLLLNLLMVPADYVVRRKERNRFVAYEGVIEPCNVPFLTAYLREKKYTVAMGKVHTYDDVFSILDSVTFANRPIVGISALPGDRYVLQQVLDRIKQRRDGAFIVVGGMGPTISPDGFMELDFDCLVVGEGEEPLAELVDCVKNGRSWHHIGGVCYRDREGLVHKNPPTAKLALDSVPRMARDYLEDIIDLRGKEKAYASIYSTRGCYKQCTYCSIQIYERIQPGAVYRFRTIDDVVDELDHLYKTYGVTRFNIADDNFIAPGKRGADRLARFVELVRKLDYKISFVIETRPDTLRYEYLRELKTVGLSEVSMGVENINEYELKLYRRGMTVGMIHDAFHALYLADYFPTTWNTQYQFRIGYIAFHPFVTVESLRSSANFLLMHQLSPKKLLRKIDLYEFTEFYEQTKEKGLLVDAEQREDPMYRFEDPRIESFHDAIIDFYTRWLPVRDHCRRAEARLFRSDTGGRGRQELYAMRKSLDALYFQFFLRALDVCDRAGGEVAEELSRLTTSYGETLGLAKQRASKDWGFVEQEDAVITFPMSMNE